VSPDNRKRFFSGYGQCIRKRICQFVIRAFNEIPSSVTSWCFLHDVDVAVGA